MRAGWASSVKSDEVLFDKGVGNPNVTDQRLARSQETLAAIHLHRPKRM